MIWKVDLDMTLTLKQPIRDLIIHLEQGKWRSLIGQTTKSLVLIGHKHFLVFMSEHHCSNTPMDHVVLFIFLITIRLIIDGFFQNKFHISTFDAFHWLEIM